MKKTTLTICTMILAASQIASAAVFELTPSKDATIHDVLSDGEGIPIEYVADGSSDSLFAGLTIRRGVIAGMRSIIAFDIAGSLPEDAVIEKVRLEISLTRAPNSNEFPYFLHVATTDWSEGPSNAEGFGRGVLATTGDSTWIHTNFDSTFWASPGGDFMTSPSATTMISTERDDPYFWESEQMVADVQNWLENPEQNFGWFLIGVEDRNFEPTVKKFGSKDNIDDSVAPKLIITTEGNSDQWIITEQRPAKND